MFIDVEKELGQSVVSIGGTLVPDIVGSSPNFNNADYLFDEFNIVAELKILSVDQMVEPSIRDKMSAIYRQASARGEANVIAYGEAIIAAGNLSPEFSRKMGEVYRKPIQRLIKKANKQIRQTKEHLPRKEHSGLLILVNDNHRALEPQHIQWILRATLHNRNYSSIDTVLYFTANLKARHPELDTDFLVWIEQHRPNLRPCDDKFLTKLRESWFRKMSEITGNPISSCRLKQEAVDNLGPEFE